MHHFDCSARRPADRSGRRRLRPHASRLLPLAGLAALLWFLIRVVPRPSRAAYPCQRAAFPLAAGFVLWLAGLLGAAGLLRRAAGLLRRRRTVRAAGCLALGLVLLLASQLGPRPEGATAAARLPNDPLGTARGVQPGRVVWVHDPAATDWLGPGDGHWWEPAHTDQGVVAGMLARALRSLTGAASDTAAWDGLFRHFNLAAGRGDVGYLPGEKIVIKVNLVGCHYEPGWGGVDPDSYDLVALVDYMNTSPQAMLALLRQLVNVVGAAPADISLGDPLALFPNQYVDLLAAEFPDVRYLDHDGGNAEHPRTAVQHSAVPLHWSCHPAGVARDYAPACYVEAAYLINLASFKSHSGSGVTLGAKNHYGSLFRLPVADGYYDMHQSLAYLSPDEGSYRALVDLMGHAHLGGKTLLCLVDGLYAGIHPVEHAPRRWDCAPFDGDWTSSLFASQDPVALESVCFDLMQLEGDARLYPQMPGADDHLHEAALADDPPSGTFYDPDHAGDVVRLASLGVHEHWNNPTDRLYSRNLGTGDGIELVRTGPVSAAPAGTPAWTLEASCYPNPFNPRTRIRFRLPAAGRVTLEVYDAAGRRLATLLQGELAAGPHETAFDGTDARGRPLPSGVYFYRIATARASGCGRMLLLR